MPLPADLPTDYVDNSPPAVSAARLNAIGAAYNELKDAVDAIGGGGGGGAATRPLSSSYRPLKGVRSDITSTIITGTDTTGVDYIAWSSAANKYRFVGCVPVALSGDAATGINNNNTLANGAAAFQSIEVEFWTNATDVRARIFAAGTEDMWATVDDMLITPPGNHFHLPSGLNTYTWKLTSGSAVWRKYRIHVAPTLQGIQITTGAKIVPTTPGFQLLVIGDSWVHGLISVANAVSAGVAGVITSGNPFGELELLTGVDMWRQGVSGSGYVTQGSYGSSAPFGSAARIAAIAAMPPMDAVLIEGSANDSGVASGTLTTAANAAWSAIKAAQPDAPLIVMGAQPMVQGNAGYDAVNSTIITAAQAHADVDAVIDIRSQHAFITGTGRDGTPANDGNSDGFVSADGLHFTHHGNRYAAEHLARLLGTVPIPADVAGGMY